MAPIFATSSPVLDLALPGGHMATVSVRPDSTCVAVDGEQVSSFDLSGRPYVLVRDGWTWRRGFDGWFLRKRTEAQRTRVRVPPAEGAGVVEAARRDARTVLEALHDPDSEEARGRLEVIAGMHAPALARDAARFQAIYRPIGVLPPDEYLALVLQATEGCSWNGCVFCSLYHDAPFRVRSAVEFSAHVAEVRAWVGAGLALRRSIFLGSANALCASDERVLGWMEEIRRHFAVAPAGLPPSGRRAWAATHPRGMTGVSAFVDAWTGARRSSSAWREMAELGLRRVHIGLESGSPALLERLGKRGSPEDAVDLVAALHAAGLTVAVIVLVGAGGREGSAAHAEETGAVLGRMGLGTGDVVYFSNLVGPPPGPRGGPPAAPLDDFGHVVERERMLARATAGLSGARIATYDLGEFIH